MTGHLRSLSALQWMFRIEKVRAEGRRAPLRIASLALCVVAGLAGVLSAETTAKCPMAHKLTLEQVTGRIQQKLPEDRTVELIRVCHVSFSLDAPSLEKLANAGMTDAEFNILNPETAAGLTVDQAHAEVQGLEAYIGRSDPALAAQQDAEIQKVDAAYQADRAKAANIGAKGEFESTADYNRRVQQSKATLADLDRKHDAVVAQVKANYQAKLEGKFKPFHARIEFLKQTYYATDAKAIYVGYNADTNRLTTTVAGEEYWFDQVPAAEARQMKENWNNVTVARAYDEDELKTLVLRLSPTQISEKGYSAHAKQEETKAANHKSAEDHVAKARELYGAGNFDGALAELKTAQELDPGNAEALSLTAEVTKAKEDEAAESARIVAAGEWVDERTSLMWTLSDNGKGISQSDAIGYCASLRTGGYSDWRLPWRQELHGIYDTRSTRNTPPTKNAQVFLSPQNQLMKIPKGATFTYHIAGGIMLTSDLVWEGGEAPGPATAPDGDEFSFGKGETMHDKNSGHGWSRALCVRTYEKPTHLQAAQESNVSAPAGAVSATNADGASEPSATKSPLVQMSAATRRKVARLDQQGEALYNAQRYTEAFPFFAEACTDGEPYACGLEGLMFIQGQGVTADPSRGAPLVSQSCEAGQHDSCVALGHLYETGTGVTMDGSRARTLYGRACEAGVSDGCSLLGVCYLRGTCGNKDPVQAKKYLTKACAMGDQDVCELARNIK